MVAVKTKLYIPLYLKLKKGHTYFWEQTNYPRGYRFYTYYDRFRNSTEYFSKYDVLVNYSHNPHFPISVFEDIIFKKIKSDDITRENYERIYMVQEDDKGNIFKRFRINPFLMNLGERQVMIDGPYDITHTS